MEKKKKIVIVDDEVELVDAIRGLLETRGFEVECAHNGEEGLELIKKGKPDLVILDIMMPKMDGRDVLIELKKGNETKNIKVIMLSARSDQFDRNYGIELGAHEYIVKPYNSVHLLERITNLLEERKSPWDWK